LNEQVGGYDQDGNTRAARSVADPEALLPTYEGGLRNSFTGEAQYPIPIITQRTNASGTGDIHDTMQDLIIRAKLQRAQGRADNQIIWTSSTQAAVAGVNIGALSIDVMNEWLDRIAADPSPRSFDKVARNKPASGLATDACWDKSGNRIAEPASTDAAAACNLIYPRFSTVRLIAGVPLAHDEVKCQLTPVDFSGYAVSFTAEQQARLRAVFPDGVCDWSKLSLDQVTANTWTAYVDGFGFMPLPDPPVSVKHVSDNRQGGSLRIAREATRRCASPPLRFGSSPRRRGKPIATDRVRPLIRA